MPRSIYYHKGTGGTQGASFGMKPYDRDWTKYHQLKKNIGLKQDLGWKETSQLQSLIQAADMWHDFPASGLTLVSAEVRPGDENQRVDLLYLREDGGLFPAELKIGGTSKDTVGQLLRYVADLHFQDVTLDFLEQKRERHLERVSHKSMRATLEKKYTDFISKNQLEDRFIRLLPKQGLLLDEEFPPPLLKTVRYLNDTAGFSILLIKIEAFVCETWTPELDKFIMRLDFTPIT